MVEQHFIESVPILMSNGSGGGDHIRKFSATPTTHVIRGIRGRWYPKFKIVSGLMPTHWLPVLLLFITLTTVMISACLIIKNFNRNTDIDPAPITTSEEQVLFQYVFSDVNTLSVAQFSKYISIMAKTYDNLKFKIFFLKDDINNSFSLEMFSDMWAFMGLKQGNVDITSENVKTIQELHNNHSNVKIIIKRLSNYVGDKCWRYRLRKIQPMNVPFFLRVYSVWRFGGIAMDLLTYNQLYQFRLNDYTANKANLILQEFNNKKAAGLETGGQVRNFDLSLFDFLSNFIEIARMNFMPLQIGGDNNKTERSANATENKLLEKALTKRSAETSLEFTAPNNKITEDENHPGRASNSSTESILKSAKNISSIKEQNHTTTKSKLILALVRTNSYLVGPSYFEDYDQVSTGQLRDDIYIDLTGKFVAADRPHHPFLANILASSANNLSPVKAITTVLTSKCGGKLKCAYCKTIFYF